MTNEDKLNDITDVLVKSAESEGYNFYIKGNELLLTSGKYIGDWEPANNSFSAKILLKDLLEKYEDERKNGKAVPAPFSAPVAAVPTDPEKIYTKIQRIERNFWEKVYTQLKSQEAKELFINIFKEYLYTPYQIENAINDFDNIEYIDALLKNYLSSEPKSIYSPNLLSQYIEIASKKASPDSDVVNLICKSCKYVLKDIKNQYALKNLVEKFLPEHTDDLKKYWKKVDTENNSDNVEECTAQVISYKKIFLHNINPSNPDEEACYRKIKALIAFLNKENNKKMFEIERIVIDGANEGSEKYNFIILGMKNLEKKEMLKNLIVKVAELDIQPDKKNIQNLINYEILNHQVKDDQQKTRKPLKI